MTKNWLRVLLPQPPSVAFGERLRAAVGALIGIAIAGGLSTLWVGASRDLPLLVAPMGASAVLLFAVPASPLAQPWAVNGGNFLAALIGVTAARYIPDPLIACAVALGCAVFAMLCLRCIHPPSGAVALTAVLGGSHVLGAGYAFAFVPVLLNSLLLTVVAVIFNNLTGRSYPHHAHLPAHPHPPQLVAVLADADFDDVLADFGETLDIDREDLKMLYTELRGRAEERRSAE